MKKKHNLVIGERIAEEIKKKVGAAVAELEDPPAIPAAPLPTNCSAVCALIPPSANTPTTSQRCTGSKNQQKKLAAQDAASAKDDREPRHRRLRTGYPRHPLAGRR